MKNLIRNITEKVKDTIDLATSIANAYRANSELMLAALISNIDNMHEGDSLSEDIENPLTEKTYGSISIRKGPNESWVANITGTSLQAVVLYQRVKKVSRLWTKEMPWATAKVYWHPRQNKE